MKLIVSSPETTDLTSIDTDLEKEQIIHILENNIELGNKKHIVFPEATSKLPLDEKEPSPVIAVKFEDGSIWDARYNMIRPT